MIDGLKTLNLIPESLEFIIGHQNVQPAAVCVWVVRV
jgi:hypothetical protein